MSSSKKPLFLKTAIPPAIMTAALLSAPFVLSNEYYISTMVFCCINAIVVTGLNLLMGYAGQISICQAAFYGLGAYTTAIVTATCGLPILVGLIAALALVGIVAVAIGIPTLRLSGHYLAMATLGFGIIVFIAFNETIELTGGPSGFVGIPRLALFGWEVESDRAYYYLTAVILILSVLLIKNLVNSRIGLALRAIHTSEQAAQSMGINVAGYKLFAFVLSALYAGLAGFLYAHFLSFVAPSSFGFLFSVTLITMVVFGGMGNIWGALIGAFALTALPELLRSHEAVEVLSMGVILVLAMIFMPDGITGGLARLFKRLSKSSPDHESKAHPNEAYPAQTGAPATHLKEDSSRGGPDAH